MRYYIGAIPVSDELYHYGIKGQKWGIRRYQNEDGSLTEEGKKRYNPSTSVYMPHISIKDAESIGSGLNKLKTYTSINSDKLVKLNKQIGEIVNEQRDLDTNSKEWAINADKLGILGKRYVETRLQNIAYINMMSSLLSEAQQRGYSVEQKPVKGKYKDESKRPYFYDVKGK